MVTLPLETLHPGRGRMSMQLALLALVAAALLAGIAPAGILLERWLARELEARAWSDAMLAPAILADRTAAIGAAMMMYAKELAGSPEVAAALARNDRQNALDAVDAAAVSKGHLPILVAGDDAVWRGPAPGPDLIQATRRGEMPVAVIGDSVSLFLMSVAPVHVGPVWLGAAGVASPLDEAAAASLAGLTRSDLVIIRAPRGEAFVLSNADAPAARLADQIFTAGESDMVQEFRVGAARYLVATATMGGARVAFVRDLQRDLSILPRLRTVLAGGAMAALAVALLLGSLLAVVLMRPVRALAAAADRVTHGDFEAPLDPSPIREVRGVTEAFAAMRTALSARITQLNAANRLLEERQARLAAMQAELIRRERAAASGRMAIELAHEIRNPVANLRNCLELLHRRLQHDLQGREYAELAIHELLRMHELAERTLDLNRPRDPMIRDCDATRVVAEVAALTRLAGPPSVQDVEVRANGPAAASIPPDTLKQVLLNLVQNARDAMPDGLVLRLDVGLEADSVQIDIADNGPGIPADVRASIFEPFFTGRAKSGGMGLGLFMVDAVLRGHGGAIALMATSRGFGARFRVTLPRAAPADAETKPGPLQEVS